VQMKGTYPVVRCENRDSVGTWNISAKKQNERIDMFHSHILKEGRCFLQAVRCHLNVILPTQPTAHTRSGTEEESDNDRCQNNDSVLCGN